VRLALLAGQLINYATLADTDTPGWSALAGNALANAGKGFLQRMYSCFQASADQAAFTSSESRTELIVALVQHANSEVVNLWSPFCNLLRTFMFF